jgi:hypothetical protein
MECQFLFYKLPLYEDLSRNKLSSQTDGLLYLCTTTNCHSYLLLIQFIDVFIFVYFIKIISTTTTEQTQLHLLHAMNNTEADSSNPGCYTVSIGLLRMLDPEYDGTKCL